MSGSSSPTPRAQPFYCPYCGEEDIVPSEASSNSRLCRGCGRHFRVEFLGIDASSVRPTAEEN